MLNECFCLFYKDRLRTLYVPGVYSVNAGTVEVTSSVTVLRNPWARQGSRVTVDIMKHGPRAVSTQKNGQVHEGFRENVIPVQGLKVCV